MKNAAGGNPDAQFVVQKQDCIHMPMRRAVKGVEAGHQGLSVQSEFL